MIVSRSDPCLQKNSIPLVDFYINNNRTHIPSYHSIMKNNIVFRVRTLLI